MSKHWVSFKTLKKRKIHKAMKSTDIIKNFFISLSKWVIFFVHLFSTASYFFIFLIISMIALFYDNPENSFVKICQFFVWFHIHSSIILFIILNIKPFFGIFSEFVGSSLLDQYFPPSKTGIRALFPVAIFVSTICILFAVDYISLMWFDRLDIQDVERMQEEMRSLFDDGKVLEG